jgi:hypothetical protein
MQKMLRIPILNMNMDYFFADGSPTNRGEAPINQGTQKETNNPWVIHPWQSRDLQL